MITQSTLPSGNGAGSSKLSGVLLTSFLNISSSLILLQPLITVRDIARISNIRTFWIDLRFLNSILFFLGQRRTHCDFHTTKRVLRTFIYCSLHQFWFLFSKVSNISLFTRGIHFSKFIPEVFDRSIQSLRY